MKTVFDELLYSGCDNCHTDGHRVLYYLPTIPIDIENPIEWKTVCASCHPEVCIKGSDVGIKFVDTRVTRLPEARILASHPECPSCHIIHDVEPDVDCSFACFCSTPLLVESAFIK